MRNLDEIKRIGIPQHALARLAKRALNVLDRHASRHPALQTSATTLTPVAEQYIAAYNAVATLQPDRIREVEEGHDAAGALRAQIRTWAGQLAQRVPGLDIAALTRQATIPDDLIAGTDRLLETLAKLQQGPTPLPFGDDAIAQIAAAQGAAATEWNEAQDILAKQQELQAEVRRLAVDLQQGLVALRRTLGAVLGRSHRDYQKLRQAKASTIDEEDDEAKAGTATPGDPVTMTGETTDKAPPIEQADEAEGEGDTEAAQ